jgi:hypothetical protein
MTSTSGGPNNTTLTWLGAKWIWKSTQRRLFWALSPTIHLAPNQDRPVTPAPSSPFDTALAGSSSAKENVTPQIANSKIPMPATNAKVTMPPLNAPTIGNNLMADMPAANTTIPSPLDLGQITTPVNSDALRRWLSSYDPAITKYLLDGFKYGFYVQFQGPPLTNNPKNHNSLLNMISQAKAMISKELKLGRIAGPFSTPPFPDFVISPLGLVPKKESGKFRMIHDLSNPFGRSVNTFIEPTDAAVSYETLDTVIHFVQVNGKGALMAKVDIEEAFRIIPIHPNDRHLLGFMFQGNYYFDKCLPMGCRTSCRIFETFSTALQWVSKYKLHIKHITHILDDFILIGPPQSSVTFHNLQSFLSFCQDCSIPIKKSKTVLPTTVIQAHGIEVDSEAMQARLPQEKLDNARRMLTELAYKKKVTLKQLQSLLGTLNFACQVIRPGRPFLRRLIDLTKGVSRPFHHIRLDKAARADINAWLVFLRSYNGISLFPHNMWTESESIKLYSDASGSLGYASVFGSKWFAGCWTESLVSTDITTKELFPIVLSLELWGHLLACHKIMFKTDNAAVAAIVNKQTCKDPRTMSLVRRLVIASMTHNILFRAKHISGVSNVIPDHLSRFRFQEARKLAPWLDTHQTPVPQELACIF